jgi:hypothetical protein
VLADGRNLLLAGQTHKDFITTIPGSIRSHASAQGDEGGADCLSEPDELIVMHGSHAASAYLQRHCHTHIVLRVFWVEGGWWSAALCRSSSFTCFS